MTKVTVEENEGGKARYWNCGYCGAIHDYHLPMCPMLKETKRTDGITVLSSDEQELVQQYRDQCVSYQSPTVPKVPGQHLPQDSASRKEIPLYAGLMMYFPLALASVASLSKYGNDKHNPGEPLHWSRDKSNDHKECIARHLMDSGTLDPDSGFYHDVGLAWRALANLQILLEEKQ